MCLLFETIKIEHGVAHNLEWHLKRIARSLENIFGCSLPFIPPGDVDKNGVSPLLLRDELQRMTLPKQLHKCKVVYTMGIIDIQIIPYQRKTPENFLLVNCDELNYDYKFLDRADINELFSQCGADDEIIIVKRGCISDSSIANLVFFDGKNYVTPDTPLLMGTKRQQLLHDKRIIQRRITTKDLHKYLSFIPINAMSDDNFDQMFDMKKIINLQ
jgi:4-amino-4-deoxychorismate lyase